MTSTHAAVAEQLEQELRAQEASLRQALDESRTRERGYGLEVCAQFVVGSTTAARAIHERVKALLIQADEAVIGTHSFVLQPSEANAVFTVRSRFDTMDEWREAQRLLGPCIKEAGAPQPTITAVWLEDTTLTPGMTPSLR